VNQEKANQLVLVAVLKRMLNKIDRDLRESVEMDRGDRKAAQADGRRIGHVLLTDPQPAFRVVDGEAFRAWVREHRPEEIVTVESVRSSYEKAVLDRGCDDAGEAIPGIELVDSPPVLRVDTYPDAELVERIAGELARLSFGAVLEVLTPKEIEP
jgi:hypothetical protein